MLNKKLNLILSTILLLLLANTGLTTFLIFNKQSTSSVKYMDTKRVLTSLVQDVQKTLQEINEVRYQQLQVLSNEVTKLARKKATKGYLSSEEQEELEEKQEALKLQQSTLQKEQNKQFDEMIMNKQEKLIQVLEKIAEKYNYTIKSTQITPGSIPTAISPSENITDDILEEMGMSETTKDKPDAA